LADIHLIAGEALLHQNHSTEAIQEYELYLKEYPDSPNAAKVRTAMAQIQAKQTKTD
jgi:regulator of sirC expression with transglutaminase-like and TPR domain